MIFGIGTDIVEISRIQTTYDRFGDHFVDISPAFDHGRRQIESL